MSLRPRPPRTSVVFADGPQPEDPTNTALGNYKVYLAHFLRDVKQ